MAFINILYNLWPNGDEKAAGLRDGIAAGAKEVFTRYGIDSPLLVAHVMAQISHECGAGHDIVENLNYSAQRMTEVWPSRFPTVASAVPYAHNPQALADKVYNGRMGNAAGSDDGWNFRGRGASQTTGKGRYIPAKGAAPAVYEGYAGLQGFLGEHGLNLDIMSNPDLLIEPKYFLECGVADFIVCGCLPYAKDDDVLNVTKRLNGGTTGLDQRIDWLKRWKMALGSGPTDFSIPAGSGQLAPPIGHPLPPKPAPLPEIKLPPPGQPAPPTLAPTFWGRVVDLFKPKGN